MVDAALFSSDKHDWQTVQSALQHARRHARAFRYGGLGEMYREMGEALEALERLKQPSLFAIPHPPQRSQRVPSRLGRQLVGDAPDVGEGGIGGVGRIGHGREPGAA